MADVAEEPSQHHAARHVPRHVGGLRPAERAPTPTVTRLTVRATAIGVGIAGYFMITTPTSPSRAAR